MSAVVRTPAEFVATVPHLVGYHPGAGDLVAVFLGLDGRKVVMSSCARVTSTEEAEQVAAAAHLAAPEHLTVLLVGYDLDRACLGAARERLQQEGSNVRDALRVTDGQVWLWDGGSPEPLSGSEDCSAVSELIGAGSAPMESRAAAYARVLPRSRAARLDLTAAEAPSTVGETWMLWQAILDRGVEGMADRHVVAAVASLHDDAVARALLVAIGGDRLGRLLGSGITRADVHTDAHPSIILDRLCGLCQALPDDDSIAPVLAVVATYAWFVPGDGAVANAVLARADTAEIQSRLLGTLNAMVMLGIR